MKNEINTNLHQALEMSLYTWGVAVFIAIVILFIGSQIKQKETEVRIYQISILMLIPYTFITGMMWLYYFTLVLCVPFFVLQLVLIWRLYRLKLSEKLVSISLVLSGVTLLFSLFSAWFFGIV